MPPRSSHVARSHKAATAKRRANRDQIKEVVFDEAARREFLTGFHKRNLEKAAEKKKRVAERMRMERLERRREQRRLLAERAAQNVAQVESAYNAIRYDGSDSEESEWGGIGEPSNGIDKLQEHEYEDEEQLAVVTVVEDFDPDTIIHGPPRTAQAPSSIRDPAHPGSHEASTPRQIKTERRPSYVPRHTTPVRGAKEKHILGKNGSIDGKILQGEDEMA